jgi:NADH-quinone oxidoreductase subunit N
MHEYDLSLLTLEAGVFLLGLLVLTLDMVVGEGSRRVSRWTSLVGTAVLIAASFLIDGTGMGWHGMVLVDPAALFFKRIFLIAALLVFIMMARSGETAGDDRAEYYALTLFATLGMLFMASSHNLMTLFMALELLTISFYVLVAYGKGEDIVLEAGIKYLIIGTVSAAFMLLGIALIYGATGSLDYGEIARKVGLGGELDPVLLPGVIILFLGLGFKVAAVPFHTWAPDVYQGAPTPVVAFLSVGSKAAGFVLLQRLVFSVFLPIKPGWILVLALVTVATLFYGNLGAIPQTNIKRLLGYSGIAQAGYVMMGLVAGSIYGGAAMLYYLVGYLFSNLLAFTVVVLMGRAVESNEIAAYSGLARRSPILAASLLVAFLSLAGVPPLVGFFGKFLLIDSIIKAGYSWIAVAAVLNVAAALFYYLQVAKVMYVMPPAAEAPIRVSAPMKAVLYACMAAILILGLFQRDLYEAALTASRALF